MGKDDFYKQEEKQRKDEEINLKIKQAVKNHQRSEAGGSSFKDKKKTRRAGRSHSKQHSKGSAGEGQALKY